MRCLAGLLLWACGLVSCMAAASEPVLNQEITNFSQFYRLPQEKSAPSRSVRFKGVVLCYDLGWGQLYVHDGSETAYFNPRDFQIQMEQGQSVEITGTALVAGNNPALTNLQIRVLGRVSLPAATSLRVWEMGRRFGQWVETEGRVRVVENSRDRLALIISHQGKNCLVYVMGPLGKDEFRRLMDAKVQVRGINGSKVVKGELDSAILYAASVADVKIIEPSRVDPQELPVVSIDALLNRALGDWTNQVVHLNGLVTSSTPGESVVVRDPTGVIRASVIQANQAQPGQRVNVWGFLAVSPTETKLADAYFEAVSSAGEKVPKPIAPMASASANPSTVLTRVSDIMTMSKEQAAQHLPVQLRGVFTYADPEWRVGFFQDNSRAVFVDLAQTNAQAGQWVDLKAQTDPGGFAPQLINATVQVLGMTNLPVAANVTLEDLVDGRLDAQWVAMEGVVRRVSKTAGRVNMTLMTRKGGFNVIVTDFNDNPSPEGLFDALVRVQGACGSAVNARGQLSGITLHTPSLRQIEILEGVLGDPFAMPTTSIGNVSTFDPSRVAGRRIKISGVVTLFLPGQGFFVQDGSEAIHVYTPETIRVEVGKSLEVLGFPDNQDGTPVLKEAIFRVTGTGNPPLLQKTTAEQILREGTHDAAVVQLEGTLLQSVPSSAHPRLVLQDRAIIFTAQLVGENGGGTISAMRLESRIRVTGICVLQTGQNNEAESFRLLVRQPQDVVVVQAASWWTLRHTFVLLGGMALVTGLGGGWVATLRSQVRQRTRNLREEIEERKRAEAALKLAQEELLQSSRLAGMAEVATSVLHNVGNVLNSVNVSATLVFDRLKASKASDIARVAALLNEHASDLGGFVTRDPRGRQLPSYLDQLGQHLNHEKSFLMKELESLRNNIGHIKDIVAMQQSYTSFGGVMERIQVTGLVEDALRMNISALERHQVQVLRDYEAGLPMVTVDKHKALQILVNLISNANYACQESASNDKRLTLRVRSAGERIRITVVDNGVGIPSQNLTRIFTYGFTTRKNGHGFGLHSGAIAAQEMGGSLLAQSDGPAKGATFILELPRSSGNP